MVDRPQRILEEPRRQEDQNRQVLDEDLSGNLQIGRHFHLPGPQYLPGTPGSAEPSVFVDVHVQRLREEKHLHKVRDQRVLEELNLQKDQGQRMAEEHPEKEDQCQRIIDEQFYFGNCSKACSRQIREHFVSLRRLEK